MNTTGKYNIVMFVSFVYLLCTFIDFALSCTLASYFVVYLNCIFHYLAFSGIKLHGDTITLPIPSIVSQANPFSTNACQSLMFWSRAGMYHGRPPPSQIFFEDQHFGMCRAIGLIVVSAHF